MRYCIDANVIIAWLIEDERTEFVDGFWRDLTANDELVGCQLLLPEVTSVLREKAHDGFITHEEALAYTRRIRGLNIRTSVDPEQFALALEFAQRTNRAKAYDMQYVAGAVLERCEMVTLDRGVYQAAREQRIDARLLR